MSENGEEVLLDKRLKKSRVLRRYVDLPKLVDLLSTSTLYLGQSSRFEDPLEGTFPERLLHFLEEQSGSIDGSDGVADWEQKNRERTYLGCWTLGAKDNMALWKLYGHSNESVAITTTVDRLLKEASAWAGYGGVSIRKVDYIDHAEQLPGGPYNFSTDLFGFKHLAYAFEEEVRVVVSRPVSDGRDAFLPAINVPVNPNSLIRSLVVAPGAGDWFVRIVTDLAAKYGINAPVRRSELTKLMRRISKK